MVNFILVIIEKREQPVIRQREYVSIFHIEKQCLFILLCLHTRFFLNFLTNYKKKKRNDYL